MPSRLAASRAFASGRTLKPMMIAPSMPASMTSFSVTAPTPLWIVRTCTSLLESFSSDCLTASTEPCTSALMMMLRSLTSPSSSLLYRSSSVEAEVDLTIEARAFAARSSTTWRASFSSATAINSSPASGTPPKPMISTGVDGSAFFTRSPRLEIIARTRP